MAGKKQGVRDEQAPPRLIVKISNPETGDEWELVLANAKAFSTGSVGFFASFKMENPENTEAVYQCNFQAILIGSKTVEE